MDNITDLGISEITHEYRHIPSSIRPDTLFSFMSKVKYLKEYITLKCIPARYCEERISYLKVSDLQTAYIPMKCFCDIKMHDLAEHMEFYGYYGIAFSKSWGIEKGLQPIQYMNINSPLAKDLSTTFNHSISDDTPNETGLQQELKNYMLHQLMYIKPESGSTRKKGQKDIISKCFADECEWRFIPDLSELKYDPFIIFDENSDESYIKNLNDSLKVYSKFALQFEYEDIKYLIVKNDDDFKQLVDTIMVLNIENFVKAKLISKIIIWEDSKGDF